MSSNMSIPRICEECGKEFLAKTTVTRFCCQICRSRFNKRIKKEPQRPQPLKPQPELNLETIKQKEFLSIKETHHLLNISERTIRRHIQSKALKATKLGYRTIIKRTDIDKLFAS